MAFHVAPGTLHERRSGKRVPQIPAVPLRDDAIVQNQYGTAVCAGTDQAPEPLFQAERSVRQHEGLEGVETRALQRKMLCATTTKSMTVLTLASPRTVNWDTPC